jgi:hypothetical protein
MADSADNCGTTALGSGLKLRRLDGDRPRADRSPVWQQAGQGNRATDIRPQSPRGPSALGTWRACRGRAATLRGLTVVQDRPHRQGAGNPEDRRAARAPSAARQPRPGELSMPCWGYYFNVAGLDAAAARVTAGGGKILNGPMEVPGGQWIVNCMDPQDAAFSLVAPQR